MATEPRTLDPLAPAALTPEPPPEPQSSRLERMHAYMLSKEQPVPADLAAFSEGMRDPERRKRVYEFVREQPDAQIPDDYAQFEAGLFEGEAEKKSPDQPLDPLSGSGSPMDGAPSGATEVGLEPEPVAVPITPQWQAPALAAPAAATPWLPAVANIPPPPLPPASEALHSTAQQYLGANERTDTARLQGYMDRHGQKDKKGASVNPQQTAWCAAFINSVLDENGYAGSGSLLAASFSELGVSVKDAPKKGDIVLLTPGEQGAGSGHVGIFDGYEANGDVRILGGNQDDGVTIKAYSRARLRDIRRPVEKKAPAADAATLGTQGVVDAALRESAFAARDAGATYQPNGFLPLEPVGTGVARFDGGITADTLGEARVVGDAGQTPDPDALGPDPQGMYRGRDGRLYPDPGIAQGAGADFAASLYNAAGPGLVNAGAGVVDMFGGIHEALTGVPDVASMDVSGRMRDTSAAILANVSPEARKNVLDEPGNWNAWAGLLGSGAGSLVPLAAATLAGGPAAGAVVGGSLAVGETMDAARQAGVSRQEAAATAIVVAPLVAGLDMIGLSAIANSPTVLRLLPGAIARLAAAETGGAVTEAAARSAAARIGARAAAGAGAEGFTEFLQGLVQGESQVIADALRDGPEKYKRTQGDILKESAAAGIAGLALGGGAGAIGGASQRQPEPASEPSLLADLRSRVNSQTLTLEGQEYLVRGDGTVLRWDDEAGAVDDDGEAGAYVAVPDDEAAAVRASVPPPAPLPPADGAPTVEPPTEPAWIPTENDGVQAPAPAPAAPLPATVRLTAQPLPEGFSAAVEAGDPVQVLMNGRVVRANVTSVLGDGRVVIERYDGATPSGLHVPVGSSSIVAAPVERHTEPPPVPEALAADAPLPPVAPESVAPAPVQVKVGVATYEVRTAADGTQTVHSPKTGKPVSEASSKAALKALARQNAAAQPASAPVPPPPAAAGTPAPEPEQTRTKDGVTLPPSVRVRASGADYVVTIDEAGTPQVVGKSGRPLKATHPHYAGAVKKAAEQRAEQQAAIEERAQQRAQAEADGMRNPDGSLTEKGRARIAQPYTDEAKARAAQPAWMQPVEAFEAGARERGDGYTVVSVNSEQFITKANASQSAAQMAFTNTVARALVDGEMQRAIDAGEITPDAARAQAEAAGITAEELARANREVPTWMRDPAPPQPPSVEGPQQNAAAAKPVVPAAASQRVTVNGKEFLVEQDLDGRQQVTDVATSRPAKTKDHLAAIYELRRLKDPGDAEPFFRVGQVVEVPSDNPYSPEPLRGIVTAMVSTTHQRRYTYSVEIEYAGSDPSLFGRKYAYPQEVVKAAPTGPPNGPSASPGAEGANGARATTQSQTAPYPGTSVAAGRIQPAPNATAGAPTATTSTALGLFRRGAGLTLRYSKKPGGGTGSGGRFRRRALGTYQPTNTVVQVRPRADLNVTSHEIGHYLDDQYDLLGRAGSAALAELDDLAQYGSTPPTGHPNPQEYQLGEGVAEYVRAYLVNPAEAASRYPAMTAILEARVPATMRAHLDRLGQHIQAVGAATAGEQIRANVGWAPGKERKGVLAAFFAPRNSDGFGITALDRLAVKVTDSARIFEKAMAWAAQWNGRGEPTIDRNPAVLARLFLGHVDKALRVLSKGMVNGRNQRLTDDLTGAALNLDFLYGAFTGVTAGDLEAKARATSELMIAERTVEYYENGIRDQITAALNAGATVDPALLASNPRYASAPTAVRDDSGATLTAQQANEVNTALGGRLAKLDLSDGDVLTGIGHGLYKDLDVARARIAEAEAARAAGDTDQAEYDEAARRYRVMADANLRYLVEKGRYSQEQYEAIKARNLYYVAMQRVLDAEPDADLGIAQGRGQRQGLASGAQLIKKATGSGREIRNPFLSLTDAVAKTIREGDRNDVLRAVTDLLTSDRQMYDGAPNQLGRVGHQVAEGTKDALVVYRDGVAEHWAFDEEVRAFLTDVERSAGSLPVWLTAPGALTRWTVTHSPQFLARNTLRDVQDVVQLSHHDPSLRDAARLAADRALFEQVDDARLLYGGGQAGHEQLTEQEYYKAMQQSLRKAAGEPNVVLLNPKTWGRSTLGRTLLHASEAQGRNLEYQAAFRHAKTTLQLDDYQAGLYAAYHSRDILDFAVAGTWVRQINQAVPFTNAAVQGTRRLLRTWAAHPGATSVKLLKYGLLPAVLTRLLVAAMGRDDDYENLPAYRRDFFFNIPAPTGDGWIIIPKPFAMGVLGSLGDRALSAVGFNEADAFDGVWGSLAGSLVPVDETAMLGGFKPLIEATTGRDLFRDKYIISPFEKELAVEVRRGTTRASRLGQGAQAISFDHVDARNVDHIVQGYGTYFGQLAMGASDVGRDDRTGLGWQSTGLFKPDNPATSKLVDGVQKGLAEAGFSQSATGQFLEDLIGASYAATTDADKQATKAALLAYARRVRARWTDEQLRQLKKDKQRLPVVTTSAAEQAVLRKAGAAERAKKKAD